MSDIKSCFPSRFPDGVVLEADFSQLEVVGLAMLTHDAALIEDLLSGRDMHTYYTAQRLKIKEEEVQPRDRTFTKKMTFQLQYGSGAKNMAKKLGLPVEDCQAFIDAYYTRYHETKAWQDEVMKDVQRSRRPGDGYTTELKLPQGKGDWESPIGRVYTFLEQDPPEWMKDRSTASFSPTQMKNYPVQGSATGDIMAVFRARVYREMLATGLYKRVLLINTVHDSVMADCVDREAAYEFKALASKIAEQLPEIVMQTWGVVCPVPFKIETKIGPRWSELEKI